MIPQRDQPWFEFHIVQPDGHEFTESLPAETVREAMDKMRRVYPDARLGLKRHYKRDTSANTAAPRFQRASESPPPPAKPAPKAVSVDFREVFGLSSDAKLIDVKKAYLEALKRYHPDRVADLGEELVELAEKKTREYNAAYKAAKAHFKR